MGSLMSSLAWPRLCSARRKPDQGASIQAPAFRLDEVTKLLENEYHCYTP